jgi:hypothetical protein
MADWDIERLVDSISRPPKKELRMTDQSLTYLQVVLDRSGSMTSCKTDIEGGFDTFIDEHRKVPGECRVSLAQFDDLYEVVYTDRPIVDVPKLDLVPRNMTALLDGVGKTINDLGTRLSVLPEDKRPGSVIVVIATDGLENASVEFNQGQILKMINHQREVYGWQFVYLGANQDAVEVGTGMGIPRAQTLTYNTANSGIAFAAAANSTVAYRGSVATAGSATMDDFTEEDRKSAVQSTP